MDLTSKPAGNVCPEDSRFYCLDVAPDVGLGIHDLAVLGRLVQDRLVLVGKHNIGSVGLHAEEGLAKRSRSLPQDLKSKTF